MVHIAKRMALVWKYVPSGSKLMATGVLPTEGVHMKAVWLLVRRFVPMVSRPQIRTLSWARWVQSTNNFFLCLL